MLEGGHEEIHFFGDKTMPGGNDHEIFEDSRTVGNLQTTIISKFPFNINSTLLLDWPYCNWTRGHCATAEATAQYQLNALDCCWIVFKLRKVCGILSTFVLCTFDMLRLFHNEIIMLVMGIYISHDSVSLHRKIN